MKSAFLFVAAFLALVSVVAAQAPDAPPPAAPEGPSRKRKAVFSGRPPRVPKAAAVSDLFRPRKVRAARQFFGNAVARGDYAKIRSWLRCPQCSKRAGPEPVASAACGKHVVHEQCYDAWRGKCRGCLLQEMYGDPRKEHPLNKAILKDSSEVEKLQALLLSHFDLAEFAIHQVADALSDCVDNDVIRRVFDNDQKQKAVALPLCDLTKDELLTMTGEFMDSVKNNDRHRKYLSHMSAYGGPVVAVVGGDDGVKTVCTANFDNCHPVTEMVPYKNRRKLMAVMSALIKFFGPGTPAARDFTGGTSQGILPADPQVSGAGPDLQRDIPERLAKWLRVFAKILRVGLANKLQLSDLSAIVDERRRWVHRLQMLNEVLERLFMSTIAKRSTEMRALSVHFDSLVQHLQDPGALYGDPAFDDSDSDGP